MDLVEWLYHKFSRENFKKEKAKKNLNSVKLEDEIFTLKTLVSFILEGESIPLLAGKGIGRASFEVIFLPENFSLSSDKETNRNILIHKTLVASIILRDKLKYSAVGISYAQKTLEIYQHQKIIAEKLQQLFSSFKDFSQKLSENLNLLQGKESLEDREFSQLMRLQNPDLFFRWKKFPEKSLALGLELLSPDSRELFREKNYDQIDLSSPHHSGSEMTGSTSTEMPQEVFLEKIKDEQSPILHSFEKLETADEYHGGSRVTDAEDNLADHAQALEELNLKHVTREGGGAGSIYKGQFTEMLGFYSGSEPAARYSKYIKTAEWDFKKKELIAERCRLYLMGENFGERSDDVSFVRELQQKYYLEISTWKKKICSLINERRWKDRQLDGPEWSIDDYARYCADLKACGQGNNKFFMQSFRKLRDFHVVILMDVSLSADSWVGNRRILDIELESVGLCGLLLQDLKDPISILSTWSETRHHCYVQTLKDFHSPWSHFFNRASELKPRGYTRLGPSMRYAISKLKDVSSEKKLIILLTDGKPTDLDRYEGRYGIEDMRHAMLEAQQSHIQIQALAIDSEAKYYFPQIFSPHNYQILSDPKMLPEKLFKIYFQFIK
ncbi:MAG: VWA domain-containing protein [Bacteriovoracaceae bacterium]|nr:VWA domain-containing protein [Bacteriovoracaceae bacterium]